MDTNVADRLEIQVNDGGETLPDPNVDQAEDRLKPFRTIEAGEQPSTDLEVVRPVKNRRNGVVIGACGMAVLGTAASMFWISPDNHDTLRGATNFAAHTRDIAHNAPPKPAPLVAPAAQLARAPAPTQSPLRDRPQLTAPRLAAGGDDMAEFLRLGGQTTPPSPVVAAPPSLPPTPAKPAQASRAEPPASEPSKPAAASGQMSTAAKEQPPAPHPLSPVTPATSVTAATKPAAPATPPAAPPPPQDAVAKTAALRPAPMTDSQQVQVLELVTELGTLVRDQRAEIAQLRQDQQKLDQRVDGSLTDFGRRLSLAEARDAVSAAMDVQTVSVQAVRPGPALQSGAAALVAAKTTLPTPPGNITPARYHVQAASPGLAMLSALDASGGQEQQLPVSPGDSIPGWGKVISISQRGDTWVVKTDHGLIQ